MHTQALPLRRARTSDGDRAPPPANESAEENIRIRDEDVARNSGGGDDSGDEGGDNVDTEEGEIPP